MLKKISPLNRKKNILCINNRFYILSILLFFFAGVSKITAQNIQVFDIKSPDSALTLHIEAGVKLQWSLKHKGKQVIEPSSTSLLLEDGTILGDNGKINSAETKEINTEFVPVNYFKSIIKDNCNELTINFKNDYGVIFRVYNDAAAYRFFTKKNGELIIKNEEANFNFTGDQKAFIPIMWDYRGGKIFNSAFEALYREINISQFPKDSLAFLPVLVNAGNNLKIVITEADLEDYPGMYLNLNSTQHGFMGVYAPYPLEAETGGFWNINYVPTKRADYISKTSGSRNFPWRVVVIAENDKDLLNNDIVQKLASPPRVKDLSWIKPGQVAWDWWNNWNITHVDFHAGINTQTYKYYIDFAASNKIGYIIMDAGWSDMKDLTKINPDINVQEIVDYGKQKGVGVILWASWLAVMNQMEQVFPFYSKMGVKGFKIDFFDRDDQLAVASTYDIAKKAADFHLMVDYHGIFKPTGLQRTYPNVIGYEGVKGLENVKWADEDAPRYAVSIPFIRMLAGPMDYTPGAMRNSTQVNFRAVNDNPMSKGTRCHQLAMYVIYFAPLQMLADNPTIYTREQECTNFITSIPVTFDETVPLDGNAGEYAALARRKGENWYVGAMSNWTARDLSIDFSFLGTGNYEAEIFQDGINADRDAVDYKRKVIKISKDDKINIHLSNGGGWAARIYPVK